MVVKLSKFLLFLLVVSYIYLNYSPDNSLGNISKTIASGILTLLAILIVFILFRPYKKRND